jgi:hypothetical protein
MEILCNHLQQYTRQEHKAGASRWAWTWTPVKSGALTGRPPEFRLHASPHWPCEMIDYLLQSSINAYWSLGGSSDIMLQGHS